MSKRAIIYAWTRKPTLAPCFIGIALFFSNVPPFVSFILIGVGAMNAFRFLQTYKDLDRLLALRDDKERFGIHRRLFPGEKREILLLDTYVQNLMYRGGSEHLAEEISTRGWEIILNAGPNNTTKSLRTFRKELPHLDNPIADFNLQERIQDELDLLRATQKELNSL